MVAGKDGDPAYARGCVTMMQPGTEYRDVLGLETRLETNEAAEVPWSAGGFVRREHNAAPSMEPSAPHLAYDLPMPLLRAMSGHQLNARQRIFSFRWLTVWYPPNSPIRIVAGASPNATVRQSSSNFGPKSI